MRQKKEDRRSEPLVWSWAIRSESQSNPYRNRTVQEMRSKITRRVKFNAKEELQEG